MEPVIVFGPTGSVASVVATTAAAHGRPVVLAMRDTSKPIPGLSAAAEKEGNYTRVTADLSKPDTLAAAVKQSGGAKRAFFYLAHGTQDHMRSSIEALKSAGIEFVVFFSSFTIEGELAAIPQSEIIPWIHAQVEINLEAVYGRDNFVAIRPGGFATNMLRFKDGIASGKVRLFGEDFRMDCITPPSMGAVAGVVLADGPKNGQKIVYVYGPKVFTQYDAISTIGKALGKDLEITIVDAAEGRKTFLDNGVPPPVTDYMISKLSDKTTGSGLLGRPEYETGVENVMLYTGKPSMGLEEWATANKELFLG